MKRGQLISGVYLGKTELQCLTPGPMSADEIRCLVIAHPGMLRAGTAALLLCSKGVQRETGKLYGTLADQAEKALDSLLEAGHKLEDIRNAGTQLINQLSVIYWAPTLDEEVETASGNSETTT